MVVNEMNLPVYQEKLAGSNRILGLLAIIGAPTLLVQFIFEVTNRNSEIIDKHIATFFGVVYIGGWICGAIGMRRLRVTGSTNGSKIVFIIQLILLSLAFLFSVQETLGVSYENGGRTFFAVCDAGYPLSHLFMIIVGIFVFQSKAWTGFRRFAPCLVGAALPLTLALIPIFGMEFGVVPFGVLTTIGLGTIGYSVFNNRK